MYTFAWRALFADPFKGAFVKNQHHGDTDVATSLSVCINSPRIKLCRAQAEPRKTT